MMLLPAFSGPEDMRLGWLTGLVLGLWMLPLLAATPEEEIAFKAAVRAFEDHFYDRAEAQFIEFSSLYASSDLASQAKAFALRARAHGQEEKQRHAEAAATFRRLRLEFPNSPNHLEFVVGEAWNRYRIKELDEVLALLDTPEGPFRLAATIRPNDPIALPLVVSGQLLLAQSHLDRNDYASAKTALDQVTDWDLRSEFSWRRRMILTKIQLANNDLEMARQNANALMDLANALEVREWIGESAAILGEVLIANQQPEAAILAYTKNLAPDTPALRRRDAWIKIIELNLEQRDARTVITQLEQFIAERPDDPALDIALLTVGELNLQLYYEENAKPERLDEENTNRPMDYLNESRLTLERLIQVFPESHLVPKAQYHRGWCYWELNESQESVAAFQSAAARLPNSEDAAIAQFKLADGYYVLGRHQDALNHYKQIIQTYSDDIRIRESFLDQVLYQTVRASIAANDLESAREAVKKLIAYYPDNLLASTSQLLIGQHMIHIDKVSEARGVFYEMIEHFTQFPLKAEVDYVIAYSFELEGNWATAAAHYRSWIEQYPDHASLPRAAYATAWCTGQQGKEDDALELYRAYLKNHEGHELNPVARLWIGNYHFNRQNFEVAERQYNAILKQPHSPEVAHRRRAALMAGRSSFRRGQYQRSIRYLTDLSDEIIEDETVAASFKAQVELNLGDALFERGKQSTPVNREEIRNAQFRFSRACIQHADSRLASIAFGRYGDASYFLEEYPLAIQNYQQVITLPASDISLRSQAEVALGMVYERQAEIAATQSPESGKKVQSETLINQALTHYLNIVYLTNMREGETPNPFWLEEAGIRAGVLFEARNDINAALRLYRRLADLLPPKKAAWNRLGVALESRRSQ